MSRKRNALAPLFLLVLSAACSRAVPEASSVTDSPDNAPATDCRRDISAADCAQASASLQQDAADLGASAATAVPIPAEPTQNDDERATALMAEECRLQRHTLAILKRRERGEGEMLSDEERAQLPAEIDRVQAYLDTTCK